MAVFAPADEADGLGLPHFSANPDTASAKNTIGILKRITDLFHPAANSHVLHRPGVWGLGDQQFGQIPPKIPNLVGITADDHSIFHRKGTGGGHLGTAVYDLFHHTKTTGPDIR
jgi:hypothetical protein